MALYGTTLGTILLFAILVPLWSAGVFVFASTLLDTMTYRLSTLRWTPVDATIIEQKIEAATPASDGRERRRLRVIARYQLHGESYVGPEPGPVWAQATQLEIDSWRDTFSPGSVVTLYVDPSAPLQGTWQRGLRRPELQQVAFFSPLLGGQLMICIALWRWFRGLPRNQIAPQIFIRSRTDKSLEITWYDADPAYLALVIILLVGLAFAVLAQAFSNVWILSLLWLAPIVMALGVFVRTQRAFWSHDERLIVQPGQSIQSFSPTVAFSKLDIDSIVFDVTSHASDDDTKYTGHLRVVRRDGVTAPLASLPNGNDYTAEYVRARMMAKWIANALGVPCAGQPSAQKT